jgi:hypothetical protein
MTAVRVLLPRLLATVLALGTAGTGLARTSTPKNYATLKVRDIEGGRKVLLVIPQTTIDASFENLHLGPGLVPGLTARKLNDIRAHDAAARVAPLAAALTGYDFNGRIEAGVRPTLDASTWVRPRDFEFTVDGSGSNLESTLNESNTRQMLVVFAGYYIDHHEQRLIVELKASILVRKIPKGQPGSARLKDDYIPFRQIFRSIFYLPDAAGAHPDVNVARWAADDGKLARRALDSGIAHVTSMLAAYLDADEATVETWRRRNGRKTVERYEMLGWVAGRDANGLQFVDARTGSLNHIATIGVD